MCEKNSLNDFHAGRNGSLRLVLVICPLLVALACNLPTWSGSSQTVKDTTVPIPALPTPNPSLPTGGESPLPPISPGTLSAIPAGSGTTYYIRPDGGTLEQCTGLVDAAYPGSGQNQPCAWQHPFDALPPGGPSRLQGGDTLVIGAGSYMIGLNAPGASANEACTADNPWDCTLAPLPSGPDENHPTRILGAGWDAGCPSPPELWGTQRSNYLVNLAGSSNVVVACLEITDHSGCVENHTGGLACQRDNPPYGDWAAYGLYAADSSHVLLQNLNIHGLAAGGVHAGRLSDWRVENVRIVGNGSVGWEGDLWEGSSANTGDLIFRRLLIEWNGCGETYPGGQPTGCWAQEVGGYGDGLGTAETGGHWVFEDSVIQHNTQDGLDLLYTRLPDASIEIRRSVFKGNAGNQVKASGDLSIENSLLVGNCSFFVGKPFTYNVDTCRAGGNTLLTAPMRGDRTRVVNSTLASQGDCLLTAECGLDGNCDGSESIILRNNIFLGFTEYLVPDELSCLVYQETIPGNPFDVDYSVISNVKDDQCPVGAHDICADPQFVNAILETFDAHLQAGSPAINAADSSSALADDIEGKAMDAQPDIGAYER